MLVEKRGRGLLNRVKWHLCCAAVVAVTYAAVYCALQLPRSHGAANFVFTAFPAALAQFVIIDIARSGFRKGW